MFVEVKISAYQAVHGPPEGPYLAFHIEAEGRSVLIPAAHDADLFIAEAYSRGKAIFTHLNKSELRQNALFTGDEAGPLRAQGLDDFEEMRQRSGHAVDPHDQQVVPLPH